MKKDKAEGWIDVHNDHVMRAMGLYRPFNITPRDPSVWTKTNKERKELRKMKHSHKEDMHFHAEPKKFIKVRDKLVIYLKKNKIFPNTTYSFECWQSSIPSILAKFVINKNHRTESIVLKYRWNGKTYNSSELPFWRAQD